MFSFLGCVTPNRTHRTKTRALQARIVIFTLHNHPTDHASFYPHLCFPFAAASAAKMTMRVTPGKIYGFGFAFMVATTVWNRYSNKGLMERVEGVKQEKLRQAAELRSTTTGDDKR